MEGQSSPWTLDGVVALLKTVAGLAEVSTDWAFDGDGPKVFVRHDLDFSTALGAQLASAEADLGIPATYFVQCVNAPYSLDERTRSDLRRISDLGHSIGLHAVIKPMVAVEEQLAQQFALLASVCADSRTDIISIHRPRATMNEGFTSIPSSQMHTYEARFVSAGRYLSDSGGVWGSDPRTWASGLSVRSTSQLLIHPLWWLAPGKSSLAKLAWFTQTIPEERRGEYLRYLRQSNDPNGSW